MSDKPRDGLDRRDFMIAAIGVSAAMVAGTDARAQSANASAATAAAASQGTVYTGDVI